MFNPLGLLSLQYDEIQKEYFKSKEKEKMSKELTPLEVWKGIQWALKDVGYGAKEIIENALEKQEQDQKKLKAYEIIIRSLDIEEEDFCYDKRTDTCFFIGCEVSKKEYDLLKEVLL